MRPKVYVLDRFYPTGVELLAEHADAADRRDPPPDRPGGARAAAADGHPRQHRARGVVDERALYEAIDGGTVDNQANSSLVTARQLLEVLAGGEPDTRVA